MTKRYSTDVRNLVVRAYKTLHMSCRKVAPIMNVSKSTVHRWVNQHPVTRPNRPNRQKVTQHVLDSVKAHLDRDPFLTAADLVSAVHTDCNVTLSKSTIPSCLKRIHYSRKRTYARSPDTEAMQARRRDYSERVSTIDMHDVISVDETCFYLDAKPSYGYAKRGVRIGVPLTRYRKAKVTLILAIGSGGVQHYALFHGSVDAKTFAKFVTEIPKLAHQRHLLMDNVAFHKSQCVVDAMIDRDMVALFNAPYTPEWNPVEYVFSKVKRIFMRGRHPVDQEDRDAYIEERVSVALEAVTEQDTLNCFMHCWRIASLGQVESLIFQDPPDSEPLEVEITRL